MPTSLTSLLVVITAIVPGILGNAIFSRLLGTDWRERESAAIARVVAFSVFGLALYAWASAWLPIPPPSHVLPGTYAADKLSAARIADLAGAYIGHSVASGITGALAALGTVILSRLTGRSTHPAAWDEFVARHTRERWVVIALVSGEAYCGKIETVDASIDAAQRDLLLSEPALYDAEREEYVVSGYRHLFIRAALIDSVASVRDESIDQKLTTVVGESLFLGESNGKGQRVESGTETDIEGQSRADEGVA